MKRYVIVGGGAAGLTLAYYLCKAGMPVTVVEREAEVGGLSRSFHYGDWCFDIGPHRFFSQNPQVNRFLREIHGDQFAVIPRFSLVYFMGHYHDWPLRLETIFKLPFRVACSAGIDMLFKTKRSGGDDASFETYVLRRYGRTLYNTFFKEYTEKFVGIPAATIHRNWAQAGIERATIDNTASTASLFDIFKLMLLPKKAELNFLYPLKGGICAFWENCRNKIEALGGEILTNCEVSDIKLGQDSHGHPVVEAVDTTRGPLECQELAWGASINTLANQLELSPTTLDYRAQIICNIELSRPPLQNSQWCYYGAKDLLFSRTSNPANFSSNSVPSGKGALCVELTCQYQDALWDDPQKMQPRLLKELKEVGAIDEGCEVENCHMEKIREAYPIYSLDYIDRLNKFIGECGRFDNLSLLGRTGRFWYNNLDHSIENSLSTTLEYLKKSGNDSAQAQAVLHELEQIPESSQSSS